MYEHLNTWTPNGFPSACEARLDLWETGRTRDGKHELRYALWLMAEGRSATIEGEDFWPSPLHALDSDESAAGLLGFLAYDAEALRFGTDDELIIQRYSERQRELLERLGDELSMWSSELEDGAA